MRICSIIVLAAIGLAAPADAEADVRIKDITSLEGVRSNNLTGIGLVIGLQGTGGRGSATSDVVQNMLRRFNLNGLNLKTNSVSLVAVTADLPIFAKPGSRIDVTVSCIDDAKSLQGGTLLLTPLIGIDDKVYALASGAVSIGGFVFGGQAATAQKNHPTVGRIPVGAVVEEAVKPNYIHAGCIRFLLFNDDFETAHRIADAINHVVPNSAIAIDGGTVKVALPPRALHNPSQFIGLVGSLRVTPDTRARVIINERTGTVVVGENVRIAAVSLAHANLAVITGENPQVSQPAPFSDGETTVVPRTDIDVIEENSALRTLNEPVTVGDLARALNALGVTPRDLSSIFQSLKSNGALHAELILQ